MLEKLSYLTDDRDLPEEDQRELVIFNGGNGDWYVQVAPKGGVVFDGVRICTSGGASTQCPGLGPAIAEAYRAMAAAKRGELRERVLSRQELEEELEAWRSHFPNHRYEFFSIVFDPASVEVARAEFEANIEQHYPAYMASDWFSFDRRPDGIYEKIVVQCMWISWQAART